MYGRDSDNSPLLKLIFPNMMKVGRINSRSLEGPIRLPKGPKELMKKIEETYDVFYQVWNTTQIPKLLKLNKWYDEKENLKVGDVIYFPKEDGKVTSKWTMGVIDSVETGKDGIVRRVDVKYFNHNENFPRFTDRSVRNMKKLFNIDDSTWLDDMKEVEKLKQSLKDDDKAESKKKVVNSINDDDTGSRQRLKAAGGYNDVVSLKRENGVQHSPKAKAVKDKFKNPCNTCCCFSHCSIDDHGKLGRAKCNILIDEQRCDYSGVLDSSWSSLEEFEEQLASCLVSNPNLLEIIAAVNTDLTDANVEEFNQD